MSPRTILLAILMRAKLSTAQRETLQGYLLRLELGMPLSVVALRQVQSIAQAAGIVEPPAAPKGTSLAPPPAYVDGSYSSKVTAGTRFAERVLQNRPLAPPGRRTA